MNVEIVRAGAGSGKTYELAQRVVASTSSEIDASEIVLTTFTRRAASELRDRAAAHLIREGRDEDAARIQLARIGTVNSVCEALLREHAFSAGLAVRQTTLDDVQEGVLFREALGKAAAPQTVDGLTELADRLSVTDWQRDVAGIVRLARSNGIEPAALAAQGEENVNRILSALGSAKPEPARFRDLVASTLEELESAAPADERKGVTQSAIDRLHAALALLERGDRPSWDQYRALAALSAGADHREIVEDLREVAFGHHRWTRFQEELAEYVRLVFGTAAATAGAYETLKLERGLVDFADQERLCLDLLRNPPPEVRALLAERIGMVLVDEFQDTSPVQLALFLELARYAKRCVWVGDAKQAIYGFRGSDPALMRAAVDELLKGAAPHRLSVSYRSVPELVEFANDHFVAAFEPQGMHKVDVELHPREGRSQGSGAPALESWVLRKANPRGGKDQEYAALAGGLRSKLDETTGSDPLRPSDIAILARTNPQCTGIARALMAAGIPVSRETPGLLAERVCQLIVSAYTLLVDPTDALAAARVAWLCDDPGDTRRADWLRARTGDPETQDEHPTVRRLRDEAMRTETQTPSQTLSRAADISDAHRRHTLSDSPRHHAENIEQLLALGSSYGVDALASGQAATHTGLLSHFQALARDERDRRVPTGTEGVTVATWHGAKGLEWPMVIIYGFADAVRHSFYGTTAVSAGGIGLTDPLAGRSIRFTPFPYHDGTARSCAATRLDPGTPANPASWERVGYHVNLMATPEYKTAARAGAHEHVRLLYVAVTRARDRLVFAATRPSRGSLRGLSIAEPSSPQDASLFDLPQDPANPPAKWIVTECHQSPGRSQGPGESTWYRYVDQGTLRFDPARITPSAIPRALPGEFRAGTLARFADPLAARGSADPDRLGTFYHRFMAVESDAASRELRLRIAERLLRGSDTGIDPSLLCDHREALGVYLRRVHHTVTRWRREEPIVLHEDGRVLSGIADLVGLRDDGFLLFDYKLVRDAGDANGLALRYGPQLAAYRRALSAVYGSCRGMFLVLPLQGTVVEILERG